MFKRLMFALCALVLASTGAASAQDGLAGAVRDLAGQQCSERQVFFIGFAEDSSTEPQFLAVQGPCTVIRQCGGPSSCPGGVYCPDVDIQCSSSLNGTCESGPGTCGGWVKCDGKTTPCPTQQCPDPCGGAPRCNTHSQCESYCSPDPPWCSSGGCCLCV
jgi:hypothetical protein